MTLFVNKKDFESEKKKSKDEERKEISLEVGQDCTQKDTLIPQSSQVNHSCYYDLNGFIHVCNGLKRMLELDKNIEIPNIFNFNTAKERNAYVAVKSNKKLNLKGICFNVCPFCCEEIVNDKGQLNTDKIPRYGMQGKRIPLSSAESALKEILEEINNRAFMLARLEQLSIKDVENIIKKSFKKLGVDLSEN